MICPGNQLKFMSMLPMAARPSGELQLPASRGGSSLSIINRQEPLAVNRSALPEFKGSIYGSETVFPLPSSFVKIFSPFRESKLFTPHLVPLFCFYFLPILNLIFPISSPSLSFFFIFLVFFYISLLFYCSFSYFLPQLPSVDIFSHP